ncbi:FliH/SctL family protein [Mesoaciditoga sp.]
MSDIIKSIDLTDEVVIVGPKKIKNNGKLEEENVEDPIEVAKRQAEEILSQAKHEAQQIIDEAKAQSQKIKEEAQNTGYIEGVKKAEKELNEQIETVKTMINKLNEQMDSSVDGIKSSLVDLSLAVIREILLVEEEKGDIEKKVEKALESVKSSKEIVLKLSSELPKDVIEKFSSIEKVQVITLSNLKKMDVQVEADFGTLDLRVDSQLELFERLVKKAFGKEG